MGYRLEPKASTSDEVRRVATELLDEALARLERVVADDGTAVGAEVHEVRKRCKEVRALARLVRSALGARFGGFDRQVRKAAHRLSSIRDAHATLATLEALESSSGAAERDRIDRIREVLTKRAEQADGTVGSGDSPIPRALERLAKARVLVDHWETTDDFTPLAQEIEKTYTGGRHRMERSRKKTTDERMHEWRKAVKRLGYQLRLVEAAGPT